MCNNKMLLVIFPVLLFMVADAQVADQQSLDSFSAKFITAIRAQEKQRAYLVTDKSVYTAGEYIWFRAFLLNAITQKTSNTDRFLFADLVNNKDSVIKTVILDASNRQLSSRIYLPDSMHTGYYWLRAYTKRMAEGDTNGISVQPVYVFGTAVSNDQDKVALKAGVQDSLPSVWFFPEGGSIITGINSTVAVRCMMNGTPLITEGLIKDNSGAVVARFSTNPKGLGKFSFEPSGYKKYQAVISRNGKDASYPLPTFDFHAGQVSVTKEAYTYKLRVLLGDSIYSKTYPSYIIGISKDSMFFAAIGNGQYEIPISVQKLPQGISTFYLFNNKFKLLSQRSVYTSEGGLNIKLETTKKIYAPREQVNLSLTVSDAQQNPVPSLFTVAVVDTVFTGLEEQTICNNNPDGMYFELHKNIAYEDADLFMLVRNDPFKIRDTKVFHPESADSLFYIKGVVLDEKNQPVTNKPLTLISNSANFVLHEDTTDNNGRFCFPLEYYADSTKFVVEIREAGGRKQNTKIIADDFIYPRLKTPVSLKCRYTAEPKMVKQHFNKYYNPEFYGWTKQQLPPVIVSDERKKVNYDISKRVSPNSSILTSRDMGENNAVGNSVLKIGGVQLLSGYLVIGGLNSWNAITASSEPLLLVDGVQVALATGDITSASPVMSYLNSLNAKDIDFIEVLKGGEGANYGIRGGNGVILVNLLSQRRDIGNGGNDMQVIYAKGVSNPVVFPNTAYQAKPSKKDATTDHRSTLFWNGSYFIDNTNGTPVNFYTSDIPSTYKITITGITIRGDIIHKTTSFQTK